MKKEVLATLMRYIVLLLLLLINACSRDIPIPKETPQDGYAIDLLNGSSNATTELDQEMLTKLVIRIKLGEFNKIHSLIIIHNDRLITEEYFRGWTRHMLHPCYSETKSVTSALIGIALDQGLINGLDEKLLNFFPEYDEIANLDDRKKSIVLKNVLTMTSGFSWDEMSTSYTNFFGFPDTQNDVIQMYESDDWIKYILDLPMANDPGMVFEYNSGCTHLLSGILTNITHQSAEVYAKENLFDVLEITNWEWETDPNGISITGWGLSLYPVDMAMFGYLYLHNGRWKDEQIVGEAWVEESTSKHVEKIMEERVNFGYHWWRFADELVEDYVATNDIFYAAGYGGQCVFVIPHFNMIVVTTAGNFEDSSPSYEMLFRYILSAVKEKEQK